MSLAKLLEKKIGTLGWEEGTRTHVLGYGKEKVDVKALIEAIVTLGYPLGRYLKSIEASADFGGGVAKIYARMRTAYYQNRNEFLRLKPILQTRLQDIEVSVLHSIAKHAADFSPMWLTKHRAQSALDAIKHLL